ncbi:MAG: hypothetical protein HY052_02390 [Proteobacteria bacterium]|nr:hypothetical protein [Pseudomonadota bacterium]
MYDSFDTNEEIQSILKNMLYSPSANETLASLATASGLGDDARTYIADKLEQELVDKMVKDMAEDHETRKDMREMAAAMEYARKFNNLTHLHELEDGSGDFSAIAPMVAFIFENKGDKASPFVKIYAEEASKLSDVEYALPETHLTLMCNVLEKSQGIAPAAPKTNPFRKKSPGL